MRTVTRQRAYQFRPLTADDGRALDQVFEAMSPEARYFRYLRAMPRLTDGLRRALMNIDGVRHMARMVESGGDVVGIARIVRDTEGTAELAIEIADGHTGRGLGRALTHAVLADAAATGIGEVQLLVHPENHRAVRLFRSMGARFAYADGLWSGRLPTQGASERLAS